MTTSSQRLPAQPRCLAAWTPSASTARPTGLAHHGNQHKAAVLLWSERQLTTHIFRGGCAAAMLSDLPPAKTHSMRLPDDTATAAASDWSDVHIRSVLAGWQETVVLTSAGRLFTCETQPNRLQPLPPEAANSLGCVRAACVTRAGGFALVCSTGPCGLFVHVLPAAFGERLADATNCGGGCRYDISFEPSELQSTWHSTRFGIADLAAQPEAPAAAWADAERRQRFVRLLRGNRGESPGSTEGSCLVLSINNQLLLLVVPEDEPGPLGSDAPVACELRVLHTCGTNIRAFWPAAGGAAICVLLDSGAMDVLHASAALGDPGSALLQRSVLTFGDRIGCAAVRDDVFVFAADGRVVQVRLKWAKHRDRFEAGARHEAGLFGVTALAFVPEAGSGLLMLTENGFVYAMRWPAEFDEERSGADGVGGLQRVDDAFERRAQQELVDIVRLSGEHQV